jgi:hypothetical protein
VVWHLAGELPPRALVAKGPLVDVSGRKPDPATGVLSGTPKVGGTFWVQMQCGRSSGQLDTVRDHLLHISGQGGSLGPAAAGDDINTGLAHLKGWKPEALAALVGELEKAGCAPVSQDDAGGVLLLVPAARLAQAQGILARHRAR